jgi:plastocyanin
MRRPLIYLTVLIAVGVLIFFYYNQKSVEPIIIKTEDGFSPAILKIQKGQKVTFVNKSGHPVWPASDLHPTHSIYSEFDSRGPIQNEQSWDFIFNKTGSWKYHDHLAPYMTGVIEVYE